MRSVQDSVEVTTRGPALYELTDRVVDWVAGQGVETGLLTLYCRHTSTSLVIQENADSDVLRDLESFFRRLVPEDGRSYRHGSEGPDDMPAHIRSALTATSLNIPVRGGRLALGTWQGIFLFEHRRRGRAREVILHLIGD